PWSPPRAAERAWRPRPRRDEASARTGSPLHLLERGWGRGASVLLVVEVEPEVVGGVLVVLAVQLSAVGAAVELAHESFLPHRVVDDSRLLQQDLLLEPPDHLLPAAPLARQLLVEDDQAVGVGVAPDHGDLAESLLLVVDDRPLLRAGRPRQPDQPQPLPEALRRLSLGLVVLGLRFLEGAPHPHQVVPEAVVGGQQPRVVLGRAQDLLEGVLECLLHSLLAVAE